MFVRLAGTVKVVYMNTLSSITAVAILLSGFSSAQDFDIGWAAYRAKDYASAIQHWVPLAEQGHSAAQYHVGLLYHNGDGLRQDYERAQFWLRTAAVQGNVAAQYFLGHMHEMGEGAPQNFGQAHMWYNIASGNGDVLGGKYRDSIARQMTAEQVVEAQAMARECLASGYQKCGH